MNSSKILILAIAMAGGCQSKDLAYVHKVVVGVEVAASTDEGKFDLDIGYDREIFAVVPRRGDSETDEAVSVTSASRVRVGGLQTYQFGHVIATGECAEKLAERPQDLSGLVTKLLGSQSK